MSSELIDLYHFLQNPTDTALQDKVRNIELTKVKAQAEYEKGASDDNYSDFLLDIAYSKDDFLLDLIALLLSDDISKKIALDQRKYSSFVGKFGFLGAAEKLLAKVGDTTQYQFMLSSAVIYGQSDFVRAFLQKDFAENLIQKNFFGYLIVAILSTAIERGQVGILNILKDFLTEKNFLLSPEDHKRLLLAAYSSGKIESAEAFLERNLTPEEAGEFLVENLKLGYENLNVAELLERNPPQDVIDSVFDSEVKKTIEAARGKRKPSTLKPQAKALLNKVSSAQIDKTLTMAIEKLEFNFVDEDVLKKASSTQITHFLMQLMLRLQEDTFVTWLSKCKDKLLKREIEGIYFAAKQRGWLKVMKSISGVLPEEQVGESLIAVINGEWGDDYSGQTDAIDTILKNTPSQSFIDKGLLAVVEKRLILIVGKFCEIATQKGIDAALVKAAEIGDDRSVKTLSQKATPDAKSQALEAAFKFSTDSDEEKRYSKIDMITSLIGGSPYDRRWGERYLSSRDTAKLSKAIETLSEFEKDNPRIQTICAHLRNAEIMVAIGCRRKDVQTYLTQMGTEAKVKEAKSLFTFNTKTLQNALTTIASFFACIFVLTIPSIRKVWQDNLENKGSSFLFFDKAEKQALEVAENKLNDFLNSGLK